MNFRYGLFYLVNILSKSPPNRLGVHFPAGLMLGLTMRLFECDMSKRLKFSFIIELSSCASAITTV